MIEATKQSRLPPQLQSFTVKATIPTGSYANIQPEITVSAYSMDEAEAFVMPHIQKMFNEFSDAPLKSKGVIERLTSFNEDVVIDFDRINHTYSYQGKRLKSASGFASEHTKPFDKISISKTCEKSWGVPQADILELWDSNGKVAADFGTAVHAVLEHYFKRRELGNKILEKSKKTVNPALPNHPFLQSLVQGLEELDQEEGIEMQELLISNVERGYCGLVDKLKILDLDKKICRVQDYKITYEIEKVGEKYLEPFDTLPANKLTKYQIQMSVYANLLQLSGWTVTGLDVFNYDGNWSKHTMEVLEVIKQI